jgi:hypothetical protein
MRILAVSDPGTSPHGSQAYLEASGIIVHSGDSIVPASQIEDGGAPYNKNAFIPGNHWTPHPFDNLCAAAPDPYTISLFSVKDFQNDSVRFPSANKLFDSTVPYRIENNEIIELEGIALQFLRPWCDLGKFRLLGFNFSAGRLVTTTMDGDGARTGLHIDSWFGVEVAGRVSRPARLCFNLGPGSRFFYALATPPETIYAEQSENIESHVLKIMRNPRYHSIYRIFLPPGSGYVAPTESLIHDGSTVCSILPSLTLTILGKFSRENEP